MNKKEVTKGDVIEHGVKNTEVHVLDLRNVRSLLRLLRALGNQ